MAHRQIGAKAQLPCFTDADLLAKFNNGVANVAAVSLAINYPTMASVPHSIMNGMRNLQAIAAATEITFKDAETDVSMAHQPRNSKDQRCCALQNPKTGSGFFGVSFLSSSFSCSCPPNIQCFNYWAFQTKNYRSR